MILDHIKRLNFVEWFKDTIYHMIKIMLFFRSVR